MPMGGKTACLVRLSHDIKGWVEHNIKIKFTVLYVVQNHNGTERPTTQTREVSIH